MSLRTILPVGLVVAAATLTGCFGGATPPLPMDVPSVRFAGSSARLSAVLRSDIYITTFGSVVLYSAKIKKHGATYQCKIPFPQNGGNNLGVAGNHILWSPGGGGSGGLIVLYAPHCGQPLQEILDGHGQPVDVTFDSKGNAYVANTTFEGGHPAGNVDVFKPGHLNFPSKTLVDPQAASPGIVYADAVDAAGDVFMVYSSYTAAESSYYMHVARFPAGKNHPIESNLTKPNDTCYGNAAVDSAQNLLVVDCTAILVYKKPYRGSSLVASIPLEGPGICKFGNAGAYLYCSDNTAASVDVYSYDAANPKNTAYVYSWFPNISNAIGGVAPDPPFGY